MYYILEPEVSDNTPAVSLGRGGEAPPMLWIMGTKIEPQYITTPFIIDTEYHHDEYPDFMDIRLGVVVSERFKKIMDELVVDNVEYFKAHIVEENKIVRDDYYMVNVIGMIDAIDSDKSEGTRDMGRLFRIFSLKLKEGLPESFRIFREKQYKEIIFIDSIIADKLKKENLTGFRISEAEGWGDRHRF